MVVEKLELSRQAASLFSLWIVCKDLDLQLRNSMEVKEMIRKWPYWFEKYTHRTDMQASTYKLVFKREAMVTKDMERECKDEVALKLLYGEARNNIMLGRYPVVDPNEAAVLAAMHLLNTHGTFDPRKHGPGTNFIQESLSVLVPKQVTNKIKSQEWDQKILSSWSNLQKPEASIDGYKRYLEYVMKWDIYGATFFPACKNVPPQGYFELRTEHFLIGVHRNGICIIDEDKYKVSWNGDFIGGIEWETTPDSVIIEYRPKAVSGGDPNKRMATTLITPQAHLIDSLATKAIRLIEKAERKAAKARATTVMQQPQSMQPLQVPQQGSSGQRRVSTRIEKTAVMK